MQDYYRNLLYDTIRIDAFQKAIASLINKNSIVAEIGFGLGTYSFFCVQSGAQKVYAIEKGDVYSIGKEIAKKNNLDSKIIFFNDHSKNINLPEKVDYIIMEDYTPMIASPGLMDTIIDARERFLKPSGKFIPNDFQLKFALVDYPDFFNIHQSHKWKNDTVYGINWDYTTELLFNKPHSIYSQNIKLLNDEILLKTIDLTTCTDITFQFSDTISVSSDGIIYGLLGWWDCWFTPEQYFSNSPKAAENTWGRLFFPIRYPVSVKKGDDLYIDFCSYQSRFSGDINYRWAIRHQTSEQEYNTFISKIGSRESVLKYDPDSSFCLKTDGLIARFIFNKINDNTTFTDLASELCHEYPEIFRNLDQALLRINTVLSNYI